MAGKRSATTELNHDNWNEENEPEEAGTFAKAADDILEKRVIKTAKRRFSSRDGAMKSAFGTFAGFKTTPATSSSPFGFLANVSTTSTTTTSAASTTTVNTSSRNIATNGSKILENDASKMEDTTKAQTLSSTSSSEMTKKENEKTKRYSSDYYAKLKGLNESVATWIKTHVDANPFCILTPIFKDYEKYLKEITSKESTKIQTLHASQHITQAAQSDNQKDKSAEKKLETSSFDTSNANIKSTSTVATEWKPEKSIFSNIAANTKSIFGNTEQKMESSKSVFSNADATSDKGRSIFGNIESNVASKSIFGNTNVESNPLHKSSTISDGGKTDEENATSNTKSVTPTFPASTFSFGQIVCSPNNLSAGFSFGSAKPFSFAPQAVKSQDSEDKTDNENKDEEDEEPPKPDFKPVTEEGAVYEQRCKVYIKKNDNFSDRGVGTLYLKPTPNGKTQLIVRADTALGNLLLNILLTQSIPIKRMNKNTIMLVCLPLPDSSPPPVPMLLRVKTSEVADELFETLNKHKK
ncbi:nuclear pore complex protein Nup50 [Cataglyphis hispanica]|uniref:nuclear pore complex protein Nup50 n=1 Tax=Cataglyphis hispanica TaxID=1086592 RepID=UPI00217F3DE5|nr:nuclear pore complex protein Nup50 [Cataglyphis hispanica]XP_050446634.1 nuclear pore complex protein Nup50 [Cataglyphis hispanica]